MDLTKNIRNYLTGQIERTLNHLIASHHLDSLGAYICSPPPPCCPASFNHSLESKR